METNLNYCLEQLNFWNMVEKYGKNADLILDFPHPDDITWEHVHEALRLRRHIEKNKTLSKQSLQPKIEEYRYHMRKLLEYFARSQGYLLKHLGGRNYCFEKQRVSFGGKHVKRHTYDYQSDSSRSSFGSSSDASKLQSDSDPDSDHSLQSSPQPSPQPSPRLSRSKSTPTKSTPTKFTPTKSTPTKYTPTKSTPTKSTPLTKPTHHDDKKRPDRLPEHSKSTLGHYGSASRHIRRRRPYTKYDRRKNLTKQKQHRLKKSSRSDLQSRSAEQSDEKWEDSDGSSEGEEFKKILKTILKDQDIDTTTKTSSDNHTDRSKTEKHYVKSRRDEDDLSTNVDKPVKDSEQVENSSAHSPVSTDSPRSPNPFAYYKSKILLDSSARTSTHPSPPLPVRSTDSPTPVSVSHTLTDLEKPLPTPARASFF